MLEAARRCPEGICLGCLVAVTQTYIILLLALQVKVSLLNIHKKIILSSIKTAKENTKTMLQQSQHWIGEN